jgi:hypothetical protein
MMFCISGFVPSPAINSKEKFNHSSYQEPERSFKITSKVNYRRQFAPQKNKSAPHVTTDAPDPPKYQARTIGILPQNLEEIKAPSKIKNPKPKTEMKNERKSNKGEGKRLTYCVLVHGRRCPAHCRRLSPLHPGVVVPRGGPVGGRCTAVRSC